MRVKLEALLSAAARGVAANPTASAQDVLVFVHSVLSTAVRAAEAHPDGGPAPDDVGGCCRTAGVTAACSPVHMFFWEGAAGVWREGQGEVWAAGLM